MGRRVLRRHIWGYSVCLCPIKGTPGLNELIIKPAFLLKSRAIAFLFSLDLGAVMQSLMVDSLSIDDVITSVKELDISKF